MAEEEEIITISDTHATNTDTLSETLNVLPAGAESFSFCMDPTWFKTTQPLLSSGYPYTLRNGNGKQEKEEEGVLCA